LALGKTLEALRFFFANNLVNIYFPYRLRHAYLRRVLNFSIGPHSTFCSGVFVTGRNIRIGSNTIINRFCYLDGRGDLVIGDNVNVSHYVHIQTLSHDYNCPDFSTVQGAVVIEDDVWVGARAIILPGVHIGRGSVIGAGSVVTKNVGSFSVVAGSPAREIGRRNNLIRYKSTYRPLFDTDVQ
jgi:acetyltransferase-like isoleucine patch superfamily enzyme